MGCYKSADILEPSKQEIADAVSYGRLLTMEIEFSRKCNLKCLYCYQSNGGYQDNDDLTKEDFFDVIVQAKDLGAKTIIVLGGEPMLYPHILEMIKFIREQGLHVKLFTNGVNINKVTAKILFDYDTSVILKMSAFDENTQDMLSGKNGSYKQIQDAYKNLLDAGYPGKNNRLGVSTVICQQNMNELADIWQCLRNKNITPYFEMITPQGRAKDNDSLAIDAQKTKELFYRIQKIDREKYQNDWNPQPPLVGAECLRHLYSCVLTANGDIQPCVGVTISVGNVKEKKLKDIINDSEVIEELRNYRENIKGPCRECDKLDSCYGCRGTAYQLTGDYLGSDPSCWNNAAKMNEITYLPLDTNKIIPHKPPMRLVDKLVSVKEKMSVTELKVSEDTIFIGEDGKLDEVAYMEIIAQSMAALKGFKNLKNGEKIEGLLLGTKKLKIHGNAGVGDTLQTSIYKVCEYGDLGVIKGEILKGKEIIAEGEITVWNKPG